MRCTTITCATFLGVTLAATGAASAGDNIKPVLIEMPVMVVQVDPEITTVVVGDRFDIEMIVNAIRVDTNALPGGGQFPGLVTSYRMTAHPDNVGSWQASGDFDLPNSNYVTNANGDNFTFQLQGPFFPVGAPGLPFFDVDLSWLWPGDITDSGIGDTFEQQFGGTFDPGLAIPRVSGIRFLAGSLDFPTAYFLPLNPALPGDYNVNGVVEASDYTVWRDRLGGTFLLNDATPGMITQEDYEAWKTHFGEFLAVSGSASSDSLSESHPAVPEPCALVILLGALAATVWMRPKRPATSGVQMTNPEMTNTGRTRFVVRRRCFVMSARLLSRVSLVAACVLCTFCLTPRAWGTDFDWINGTGGTWTFENNWSPGGGPPGEGDTATFSLNNTYIVSFSALFGQNEADAMTVDNGNVTLRAASSMFASDLSLTTGAATLSVESSELTVGSVGLPLFVLVGDTFRAFDGAMIDIKHGSDIVADRLMLGTELPVPISTISVDGAGSTLRIGNSGAASPESFIGGSGADAVVTISGGGEATFAGPLHLSASAFSNTGAQVNVFDNSSMTAADLSVGDSESAAATNQLAGVVINGDGAELMQTDDASLTIGSAVNTDIDAFVVVFGGGTFHSGTGTTLVQNSGELTIGNGSALRSIFHANGDVVVDGGMISREPSGVFDLAAGRNVTVDNNGLFRFNGGFAIDEGSTFNLNNNSELQFVGSNNYLDIAVNGDGTLLVDRSTVTMGSTSLSYWGNNGHTATVTLDHEASVQVGNLRLARTDTPGTTANVEVLHGADLTVFGYLRLAPAGGATTSATLTVDAAGASFTETEFIQNGAGGIIVGHASEGSAVINVRNGSLFTTGTGETTIHTTGEINLESAATFDARGPIVLDGGDFNFLGGTLHVDMFTGDLLNQGGTLAPGHSAGTTTIVGSYMQLEDAALEIEIAGHNETKYDRVDVSVNAVLDGELVVALIEEFTPQPDRTFLVLDSGSLSGAFSNIANGDRLDTIDGIGSFLVHYGIGSAFDANQVVLSDFVSGPLLGDFNANGVADAADYSVWRDHLGTSFDLNGNGDETGGSAGGVDEADYELWVANFGMTAGSGAGSAGYLAPGDSPGADSAVPEPAGAVLWLLAACLWAMWGRCPCAALILAARRRFADELFARG